MKRTVVLATDTCRACGQTIDLRPALSGDALLWIGIYPDGSRTAGCLGNAPGCDDCGGTGDDPADPEWTCTTCDGGRGGQHERPPAHPPHAGRAGNCVTRNLAAMTSVIPTPAAPVRTGRRVVRELLRFELLDRTRPAGGDPITVRALLRWTSTDPHTVAVVFRPGTAAELTWLIGRGLLADGMHGPAGLGDVSVLPDLRSQTYRELVLSTPAGQRGFRFPVAALVAFLERSRETGGDAR